MRIIYLMPKELYDRKMSPGRVLYGHYLSRRVDLLFSGPGWDSWDDSKSVQINVDRLGGADALWVYKPEKMIRLSECVVPRFMVFNEAWDSSKTSQEIHQANPRHVFFHHMTDLDRWMPVLSHEGIPCSFINHAAPSVPHRPTGDRETRAILTGVQSSEIYPLRHKMLLAAPSIRGVKVRQHPGYRMESRECAVRQYRDYLGALKQSQMSLCCTSKFHYPLAKLFESISCGAVPVTDKPECPMFSMFLWPHCVQVSSDMSADEIAEVVNSQKESVLRVKQQNLTLELEGRFSMKHWGDHILRHVSVMTGVSVD